jgi:copper homeostasis protein
VALLEVIACSVADAVAAERGGAGRLEIVRALDAGGLTPPVSLVKEIVAAVSIPVRVMLRENPGFETNLEEMAVLSAAARELDALSVDGVVLGFLRNRSLDLASARQILSSASNSKATFHRAFEDLENPMAALPMLKNVPQFDRILVSPARFGRLKELVENAAPELTILAGGGITAPSIRKLRESARIREFHVGRAARCDNDINQPVDAQRVRELVDLVSGR